MNQLKYIYFLLLSFMTIGTLNAMEPASDDDVATKRKSSFKAHLATYCCNYSEGGKKCNAQFLQFAPVKSHVMAHLDIKPYRCNLPGCTYSCTHKHSLMSHLKSTHKQSEIGIAPLSEETQQRINQRINPYILKMREPRSTLALDVSTPIYQCSYSTGGNTCNKQFPQKKQAKQHVMMHLKIKPFHCKAEGCKHQAARKFLLAKHIKSFHPKSNLPVKPLSPETKKQIKESVSPYILTIGKTEKHQAKVPRTDQQDLVVPAAASLEKDEPDEASCESFFNELPALSSESTELPDNL